MANTPISWEKKGRIFVPSGEGFFKTHATRPVPWRLDEKTIRVFFSSRDHDDRMFPAYIDVEAGNPSNVIKIGDRPLLDLGAPGTFDDSGLTVGSILDNGGVCRVYYTGWKRRRQTVGFELSLGVAEWDRKGESFRRLYDGPIVGQDIHHPLQTAGPFVLKDGGLFRMWYCSGTSWKFPGGNPEPIYTVFHAESDDGIAWRPYPGAVIPYRFDGEVVSAPWVIRSRGKYRMWYSTRGHETREAKNYRAGYAESDDGRSWQRLDENAGIAKSDEGWDSEMLCYPAILRQGSEAIMFYCGNGVGKAGIGYAVSRNFPW